MKKYLLLVLVAAFTVACGSFGKSPEEQAKDKCEAITKALQDGEFKKAMQLTEEMEEWVETLSPEDREKVEAVAMDAAGDMFGSIGENIENFDIDELVDDIDVDAFVDDMEADIDAFVDDMEDDVNDFVDDMEDGIDDLVEDIEDLW